MEITLSKKQQDLIEDAFKSQQTLQKQAQEEFLKIQKRIDDAVTLILDAKGMDVVEGIKYDNGKLIVPVVETPELRKAQPDEVLAIE